MSKVNGSWPKLALIDSPGVRKPTVGYNSAAGPVPKFSKTSPEVVGQSSYENLLLLNYPRTGHS